MTSGTRRLPLSRGPLLVGRDAELRVLELELTLAAGGEGRGVLLIGEAGIGKTRLAGEVAGSWEAPVTVMSARGHALGGTTAFGLWAEALERHLRTLTADEIRQLCQGFLDDLATILRSVAAVRGRAPAADVPRARLLEGLAVVLANVASSTPLVLILDDVHLADASSVEALHYVAHSCAAVPLLIVATARPGELDDAPLTADVVGGLEQDGLWRRITLSPLSAASQRELAKSVLGEPPTPGILTWLEEKAGGNPLFTVGLLQAALDEGADLSAPRLSQVPAVLATRVASRLRRLDDPARSLLELLAVLGRRVELRSLVGFFDDAPGELGPMLERLGRTGLVAEEEHGRELVYEVAHPLIAEAIYEGIGAARRRSLHRRAGRVLHSAGRLGEAAPHFVRAAAPGDDEAIGVLIEAAAQSEGRGAFPEAFSILGSLAELLTADDQRWLMLVDALSWRREWMDYRSANVAILGVEAFRGMDRALSSGADLRQQATARLHLACFVAWAEALEDGERLGREAVGLFEAAGDLAGALSAEEQLSWIVRFRGGAEAGLSHVDDVMRRARAAGDDAIVAQAARTRASMLKLEGRLDAEEALRAVLATDRQEGRPELVSVDLGNLAGFLVTCGRGDEAIVALEEARSVSPDWRTTSVADMGIVIWWGVGDYRAGLDWARQAESLNPGLLNPRRAYGLAATALCAFEADDLALARRSVARARSVLRDRPSSWHASMLFLADGVLFHHDGQLEPAFAAFNAAVDRFATQFGAALAVHGLVELAEAAGRAGAERQAEDAARRLAEIAAGLEAPVCQGIADLGRAWSYVAARNRAGAADAARRAVAVLSDFSLPALLGRSLALLGTATDARAEGMEALSAASGLFERCTAVRRRREAVEALARLGRPGRRAADAALGAAALSAREREVARLAVEGLTAREIGERLFIAERTVEGHLARAYGKLGVHGRLDLVRRAHEFGLGP